MEPSDEARVGTGTEPSDEAQVGTRQASPRTARVARGRVAVTRLYDLAYAVDLERVERDAIESTTRLQLLRVKPKAVFYTHPPVDVALGRAMLSLDGGTVEVDVRARIYALGAVRLSYELAVAGADWEAYVDLADRMEGVLTSASPWDSHLARVRELIAPAMERPAEPGLEVDYLFATVERFDPPLTGEEIQRRLDLVPLLTGDRSPLAPTARREILRHWLSYFENDLVVITGSRALIVEPGGDTDVADILATAHAQLLELRYYDERLDAELPRMYDRIEDARRAVSMFARRRHASLARSLHALLAEVTEVSERIDNALVVTEDVYLARVFRAALEQYRVHDWRTAVDRKLSIIRDTYTALYDEATAERAELLEITIVLLIALEIALAFLSI